MQLPNLGEALYQFREMCGLVTVFCNWSEIEGDGGEFWCTSLDGTVRYTLRVNGAGFWVNRVKPITLGSSTRLIAEYAEVSDTPIVEISVVRKCAFTIERASDVSFARNLQEILPLIEKKIGFFSTTRSKEYRVGDVRAHMSVPTFCRHLIDEHNLAKRDWLSTVKHPGRKKSESD